MGKLRRIRTIQGSTERGAGPAIAGSEGSGFSSEKPPPEAECRPGYWKSPVFAPPAQGLSTGQARPLSQLRCQLRCALRVCRPQAANILYTFQGSQWLVRIRPRFLHIGSAYRPSSLNYGIAATGSYVNLRFAARSTTLRRSPFPKGKVLGASPWGYPFLHTHKNFGFGPMWASTPTGEF